MWWSPTRKRMEEMLEPGGLALIKPQDVAEDVCLHDGVVHTDTATSELDPVKDEVEVLAFDVADAFFVRLYFSPGRGASSSDRPSSVRLKKGLHVFQHGCGEGVMRARPSSTGEIRFVFVRTGEEGELCHPQDLRLLGWDERPRCDCPLEDLQTQTAQSRVATLK
jgi:hypothetical protein